MWFQGLNLGFPHAKHILQSWELFPCFKISFSNFILFSTLNYSSGTHELLLAMLERPCGVGDQAQESGIQHKCSSLLQHLSELFISLVLLLLLFYDARDKPKTLCSKDMYFTIEPHPGPRQTSNATYIIKISPSQNCFF